jgi:hypothetical protein
MTHKDIYTKFMIEYDKANVTSSYPSLTEYEVATVLDKAYNALIAQKVTGNNVRRASFESDIKSIADINALVTNKDINIKGTIKCPANNSKAAILPEDLLYFLQGQLKIVLNTNTDSYTSYVGPAEPADTVKTRDLPIKLVNHEIAKSFFNTAYNMPWIKEPVCYIENGNIYVVYDPLCTPKLTGGNEINVTYIKKPNTFVKDLTTPKKYENGFASYFDFNEGTSAGANDTLPAQYTVSKDDYEFECNSTMAEELISLAVTFALENVESSRLNAKLNTRGLEA